MDLPGSENPPENRMSTLGLQSRLGNVCLSERFPLHAYLLRGCAQMCPDVDTRMCGEHCRIWPY